MPNDTWSEDYPGDYLRAVDLNGRRKQFTISNVERVKFGEEFKNVISFDGISKKLVVNKTNANWIRVAYGDSKKARIGKKIDLFPDTTYFMGKQTECIRVMAPLDAGIDNVDTSEDVNS